MDIMGLSVQIETNSVPPISRKMKFFVYYIKHITGILHNPAL